MFNQYQPNLDNMQQYLSQENERSQGNGPNWWSIPSGMSSIRILPPWDPTGRVALPVFMHPIEFKGKDMNYTKYNWTCVNKTFGKNCTICEGLAGMAAVGVDISNWDANRRQFYFNAIVMHDPTYNQQKGTGTAPGTHVCLKAPKTFYDWVISQITNPMIGDITNVQNGIDVYVTKEGSGLGTTYNMTLSPNGRTPIPQEYLDKITDLYNLDDIFSAGFDQAQIDEMVDHLRKSAGVLSNGVGNAVNQMAGYTQAPQNAYPTPGVYPQGGLNYNQPQTSAFNNPAPVPASTPAPMAQSPYNNTSPMSAPAPMPFGSQTQPQPPVAPVASPQPVNNAAIPVQPTGAAPTNAPKCFGSYDAGNVNCVVCPAEIDCQRCKK